MSSSNRQRQDSVLCRATGLALNICTKPLRFVVNPKFPTRFLFSHHQGSAFARNGGQRWEQFVTCHRYPLSIQYIESTGTAYPEWPGLAPLSGLILVPTKDPQRPKCHEVSRSVRAAFFKSFCLTVPY